MRVLSGWPIVVLLVLVQLAATGSAVAETARPILYRIFLTEGDALVSYGDYVRVDDRVVFSLPLNASRVERRTQLVSIPATAVDWTTTEQYAESARYANYAATRGETDFAQLSAEVARVLNDIARLDDPDRQVALAQQTRQRLMAWTDRNYGYREDDIGEIVALLDEAITGLRPTTGSAGEAFHLSFVAMTARPPRMPLMSKPSLQEIIAHALTVSRLTPVPAERLSVLQTVLGVLEESDALGRDWRRAITRIARGALDAELRTARDYTELTHRAVERATGYAERADVRGVQSVVKAVRGRDAELGHRRPNEMAALMTSVEARLNDARALRLARDQWRIRVEGFRRYHEEVDDAIEEFSRARRMLDDIRILAGPDTDSLPELQARITEASDALARVVPPAEVQPVHQLFRQALQLARSAATVRHQAVQGGDIGVAWDAASAAAGSLMLFERASEDLDRSLRLPELP